MRHHAAGVARYDDAAPAGRVGGGGVVFGAYAGGGAGGAEGGGVGVGADGADVEGAVWGEHVLVEGELGWVWEGEGEDGLGRRGRCFGRRRRR